MDKITSLYTDYHDIVNLVGKTKIQARFQDLLTAYESFISEEGLGELVTVNSYILMHAVLDQFTDLSRLKDFHQIIKENIYKVKAYELSWLLRRKPLQVNKCDREGLVFVNEKFALYLIMAFFTELVGYDFYEHLNAENQRVFNGFTDSIYYYIKFRNCNPQALELALLCFGAGLASSNVRLTSFIVSDLKEKKDESTSD